LRLLCRVNVPVDNDDVAVDDDDDTARRLLVLVLDVPVVPVIDAVLSSPPLNIDTTVPAVPLVASIADPIATDDRRSTTIVATKDVELTVARLIADFRVLFESVRLACVVLVCLLRGATIVFFCW